MIRTLFALMSLTLAAACGGGNEETTSASTTNPPKTNAPESNTPTTDNQVANSSNHDRAVIVDSCRKFETEKVCSCITTVIGEELTPAAFKKIATEIRNGAETPMSAASNFEGADKTAFESVMVKWNENCELN